MRSEFEEDYSFIPKAFAPESIHLRFETLCNEIGEILKQMGLDSCTTVNCEAVKHVLDCYYTDIYRLKNFAMIEMVNIPKVFAYMVYWFCRIHPICITDAKAKQLFINERVIAYLYILKILKHMNIDYSEPFAYGEILETCNLLLYNLKYRIYTPQSIELSFSALLNSHKMKFNDDEIL